MDVPVEQSWENNEPMNLVSMLRTDPFLTFFGNAPDGRDHWPYCYTAMVAGAGVTHGALYGKSDATASSPAEKPVHPVQLLATMYHALGIDPHTIVYNHLNQPRELVDARFGEPVTGLFG